MENDIASRMDPVFDGRWSGAPPSGYDSGTTLRERSI